MFLLPEGSRVLHTEIAGYALVKAISKPGIEVSPYVRVWFHNHSLMVDFIKDAEAREFVEELDIITDRNLTNLDKIDRIKQIKFIYSEGKI